MGVKLQESKVDGV
ncbi:predicted protein [Fibroporia radiculosa]|uniref:Uncharacterized protein n=1 Tax=Fibroporia radiculosa TaxID=599839 RepID=J4ICR0_9APHY|nr:predicted protein [Fibroporia radiculosa]